MRFIEFDNQILKLILRGFNSKPRNTKYSIIKNASILRKPIKNKVVNFTQIMLKLCGDRGFYLDLFKSILHACSVQVILLLFNLLTASKYDFSCFANSAVIVALYPLSFFVTSSLTALTLAPAHQQGARQVGDNERIAVSSEKAASRTCRGCRSARVGSQRTAAQARLTTRRARANA